MRLKKLDLNSLVVFHAVWTQKSVSRAAEQLHVAQPTVSTCLSRLRQYFDDPLFTWEGSKMNPTTKAQLIAPEIASIIDRTRELIEHGKYDPFQVARDVVVASADYVYGMVGASLNRQVDKSAPHLRLSFVDATSELLPKTKTLQSCDLYIFPDIIAPGQGMRYKRILSDSYVTVRWKGSKLKKSRLSVDEFLKQPKVLFSVDHRRVANHEMTDFVADGTPFQVNMLVPNYLSIPSMLVGTNRVSVLPRNVLKLSQLSDSLIEVETDVSFPKLELGMY